MHWGIDQLVVRLRGMFAFGIWDENKRTLFLVRDRLGVKPLVFCDRDGEIAFASTVGALGAGGFRGPDRFRRGPAILEFGNVAGDQCIFEQLIEIAARNHSGVARRRGPSAHVLDSAGLADRRCVADFFR